MKEAVKRVVEKNESIRQVSKENEIPFTTLQRYVQKYKNSLEEERSQIRFTPNYAVNKVFPLEMEELLKEYLVKASKMHHGLTRKDTKKLAYQLAVKNNLKIPDNWHKMEQASDDWLSGFRSRFPTLSLRKPEATSLARATACNPTTVAEFFDNLSSVYSKFESCITPDRIYNLDESGLTTVHTPPNVICAKGIKQVGQVTSGERGVTITIVGIINAIGNAVPPYLIFPRVNFRAHMLLGTPPGTSGNASKSGWINGDIFVDVLEHLKKHTKCSADSPVVLIMDNHESHITINSLEFSKANGIILVTLPPHTSNKLQPLDKSIFFSLKSNYNEACNDWMLCNPGQTITIYHVGGLFNRAYLKAFSTENIVSAFKNIGIWPLNRDILTPDDYLASYVSDRPAPSLNISKQSVTNQDATCAQIDPTIIGLQSDLEPGLSATVGSSGTQSQSFAIESTTTARPPVIHSPVQTSDCKASTSAMVSPEDVRPYPKAKPRQIKINKRRRKSQILTNTPIKKQLIDEMMERNKPKTKNKVKGDKQKNQEKNKKKEVRRTLDLES